MRVDNVDLRESTLQITMLEEVLLDFCTHLTSLSDYYNEVDNDEFKFMNSNFFLIEALKFLRLKIRKKIKIKILRKKSLNHKKLYTRKKRLIMVQKLNFKL